MARIMKAKEFLAEVDKLAREYGLRIDPDQKTEIPIRLEPLKNFQEEDNRDQSRRGDD